MILETRAISTHPFLVILTGSPLIYALEVGHGGLHTTERADAASQGSPVLCSEGPDFSSGKRPPPVDINMCRVCIGDTVKSAKG